MTQRTSSRSRPIAALLLVGCAAIVVFAASRNTPTTPANPSAPPSHAPTDEVAPALSGGRPAAPTPPNAKHDEPLGHVRAALEALTAGTRSDHVRVLFFGDSHAQGEYLTDGLRTRLQARFGDGGPGFVAAGSPKHRNDAMRVEARGSWAVEPRDPATTTRHGDGRWGLGGLLARPERGTGRVELSPRRSASSAMTWDVCFLSPSNEGAVQASGDGLDAHELTAPTSEPTHVTLATRSPNRLALDVDRAALCGVVGERDDARGVVLDGLGINGARFATPLAWDEASFETELSRRRPDLVVLEYGTNEASDLPPRLADVARDLETLVSRVRRGAPEASCLVLGLTERDDRVDTTPALRDAFAAAAERAGCAFWDTYAKMGGRGSMKKWQAATPTLAQRDGIHLTRDGYDELARMLFDDLVRELPERPPSP